jgi:Ca2+-binding EF-hand superfamily protein
LKQELKALFLKFEEKRGGIDILCLGGLFEEVCHAFELGGTLSELYRLLRVMEKDGVLQWESFVGVMSKWLILKQLFGNVSKDGGQTIHTKDVGLALADLRTVWGCFDARHGDDDVKVLAKEVAASVELSTLTFEEFMNAMRYQVALKSIFELHDTEGTGTLSLEGVQLALKAVEDYSGQFPAFTNTLASLSGSAQLDEDCALTWSEFLVVANIAIGDEHDGSS